MKHLTFFVVLILLTVGAISLGFAGNASSVKAAVPSVIQDASRPQLDGDQLISDVPNVRANNKTSSKKIMMTTAQSSPVAKKALGISGPKLSGIYNIPGDFGTIEDAVAVLNILGIDGDVTFQLLNTSYVENPITFGGTFPGAGSFTVTVRPDTGVSTTIQFVSTLDDGKGFAFNGAKKITIDGWTAGGSSLTLEYDASSVFPTDDPFGATIYITGGSEYIAVKNTHVKGQVNTPVWIDQTDGRSAIFLWNPDEDATNNKNITIDGCTITNATYGFKSLLGYNWANIAAGITFTNNSIGDAYGEPVVIATWAECVANVTYTGNIVDGVIYLQEYWYNNTETEFDQDEIWGYTNIRFDFGQSTGAHYLLVDEGTFANNIHRNITSNCSDGDGVLTYATRVYGYNLGYGGSAYRPVLYNNRFYKIENGDKLAQLIGIRGPGLDAYHNSVQLSGAVSGGASTCLNGATYVYNNAFSNELTGQTAASQVGVTAGATFNYNAIFSNGRYVSGYSTQGGAVAAGINTNGSFGPVNFDADLHITTGPSTAENIGGKWILLANDIDGQARDTSAAGVRDAGADEFANTGIPFGPDVLVSAINPPPAGIPTGVPQIPIVTVKNNALTPTAAFDVILTEPVTGYDDTVSVSLGALEVKSLAFPAWTPPAAGPYTLTAQSYLGGDINATNDIATKATTASDPTLLSGPTTYDFNASAQGWTGVVDWVRSGTFTKLGGVYGGSGQSWVTNRPNLTSTYTEGAYANTQGYATTYPGANILMSPWLNISGITGSSLWFGFYHSIKLEPDWDRSWMEYTTDGLTWHHLGELNDPKGANWYFEAVYEYAHSDDCDGNIDEATLIQYGLISSCDDLPFDTWASNGGATATGPFGWVYVQLKVDAGDYTPEIIGATAIRFRYVAFSDAATAEDPGGWAFDNFTITNSAPAFTGNTITGTVFEDKDGDYALDAGEADGAGTKVYLSYFGVLIDSTTTDGVGVYTFLPPPSGKVNLPGTYNISVKKTGYAWNVPYGVTGIADIACGSDGTTKTQNMGYYMGSVSGTKWNDIDDDATKDGGEPGLSGWTVEVHKDSANGTLVNSAVTTTGGTYTIILPAYKWGAGNDGNYVVKEIVLTAEGRQTYPTGAGTHTIQITGTSGGGTAVLTGKDFGNFIYSKTVVEAAVDINGDGVKQMGDVFALQAGYAKIYYDIFKNQAKIGTDSLSDGILNVTRRLDLGTYGVKRVSAVPTGWWQTTHADSITIFITQGSQADTARYMYFKYVTVSGQKFNDLDGDGTKDAGEPGLEGWTINISGAGGGSTVTGPDGSYQFTGVDTGSHTISEVLQTGWVQTAPTSGTYTFVAKSGNTAANNPTDQDFGNFKRFSISGTFFRDRDNDGVQDAGEEGISGQTMTLTPGGTTPTGVNGEFTFADVGPAPSGLVLSSTAPSGYVFTVPTSGNYAIVATSGTDVTGKMFGAFKSTDVTTYRTFTSDQFSAGESQKKPTKYKVGKPIPGGPNTADLIDYMINVKKGGSGVLQVGLSGQMNGASKEKAYLYVSKQGDAYKTFNGKSGAHTGLARGFDFTTKAKVMLKKWKSMPSEKKNDVLVAEMLTLQINLMASLKGHTDAAGNLGALIYSLPGPWGTNVTIDSIADYADGVMTNWEGVPYWVYDSLDNAVSRINGAFATGTMTDTTADGGFTSLPLQWTCTKNVYDPSVAWFLKAAVAPPKQRHIDESIPVPDVYALGQNYPNPFNPTTNITFELPTTSIVTLKIYNLLGQEIATLIDREELTAGEEEVEFDASVLASGVYLYRIVAEEVSDEGELGQTFTQVKKMLLMK